MSRRNPTMDPQDVLCCARMMATERLAPYLAIAIYNMMPIFREGHGTITITEGMHLIVDPELLSEWGESYTAWMLIQLVSHPLREHRDRALNMAITAENATIAGACMGAEINDDIAGMRPNVEGLLPPGYCWLPKDIGREEGTIWEDYYAGLPTNEEGQKYIPGHPVLGEDRKDLQPQDGDGDGDGNSSPSQGGQPGSGATGVQNPGEPEQNGTQQGRGQDPSQGDGDGDGDNLPEGRSEADMDAMRQQVAADIQNHIEEHGAGSVSGEWTRWADQRLTTPTIPWQQQLQRIGRHCVEKVKGQRDYDYQRPARRQAGIGYGPGFPILPRMYSPVPKIDIAVDTSGSMGDEDLQAAMSEVEGVMKAMAVAIDLYVCDCDIQEARKVSSIAEACKNLKGGGGTDFRPIFEHIKNKRGGQPDILIIFTDGGGPAPEVNPLHNTHVIWVIIEGQWGSQIPYVEGSREEVTYGHVIRVPVGANREAA